MSHPINDIIEEERKRFDANDDNFFYSAAFKINKKYLFLKTTNKTLRLISKFNKSVNEEDKIFEGKVDHGYQATIEEIIVRAMAINPKNPYDYIKRKALVIPRSSKDSKLVQYTEVLGVTDKLMGEVSHDYFEHNINPFDEKVIIRIHRQFTDNMENMFPQLKAYSEDKLVSSSRILRDKVLATFHLHLNILVDENFRKKHLVKFKNSNTQYEVNEFIMDGMKKGLFPIIEEFGFEGIESSKYNSRHRVIEDKHIHHILFFHNYEIKSVAVKKRSFLQNVERLAPTIEISMVLDQDTYFDIAFNKYKMKGSDSN